MSAFNTDFYINVVPREITTLSDGVDTVININSNIDKTLGSSITKSGLTDPANVKYKASYTTTTGALGVALSYSTILNSVCNVKDLFIKITAAGSTGIPNVRILYGSGATLSGYSYLSGVGDFIKIGFSDGAGTHQLATSDITVASITAATVAIIEILVLEDIYTP